MLSPGQQLWLDLGQLVHEQVPDSDGRTLPPETMTGSYELRDLDHATVGQLYEGKLIIDKTYGHAAYGCGSCCGYDAVVFDPGTFAGAQGIDNEEFIHANDTCSGTIDDVTGSAYNWGSTNTAVATLPNSMLHTVAVGSATGKTYEQLQWAHPPSCPNQNFTPQQSVNVLPLPTNFQQIGNGQDTGGGNLKFTYNWGSTTGNIGDLSQCSVREYVTYPGTGNFNWTSPPYDTSGNPTANPTITNPPIAATDGGFYDNNTHPGFLKPYVYNQFTSTQKFQYSCTNYQNGAWQDFSFGTVSIVRTVQNVPPWQYSITKSNSRASTNLP
jgi:hypothetical protein